jgi:hypothetical protein
MPTLQALRAALVAVLAAASAPDVRGAAAPGSGDAAAERRALEVALAELRGQPRSAKRLAGEARLLQFMAQGEEDGRARDRLHAEGLALAEEALALDRDEPAAILWWTAHRGSEASPLNPVAAVRIASEVERSLLRLRELAPDHEHAAADRVLGIVYFTAPPVISVGSMKKAEQHLRDALRRFPTYPGNQLTMAELLAKKGDCRLARQGAQLALTSRELARFPLEAPIWKRQANQLLARCR